MTIIFINPRDEYIENDNGMIGDRPPLGLLSIASYIESKEYQVCIIDLNKEYKDVDIKDILYSINSSELCSTKISHVCIGVSTPNYNQCISLAKKIKEFDDSIILIAGGNHVTNFPDQKETVDNFDFIIKDDGEYALEKILNSQENLNNPVIDIEVEDVNDLPQLDYDLLSQYSYTMMVDGKPAAMVVTARGCRYNCAFCFIGGTQISMPDSQNKTIADIKAGDEIFAYDNDNLVKTIVKKVFVRQANTMLSIMLEGYRRINVTEEHPFFVDGKWIQADALKTGDEVSTISYYDKRRMRALEIDSIPITMTKVKIKTIEKYARQTKVYNLECSPYDNYFANYILVHNCGSAKYKKVRQRRVSHVMQELFMLYNRGVRAFYFGDDIFTYNKQRTLDLCTAIRLNFPDVIFRATTRADLIDDDICKALRDAGCTILSLGIESGSDIALKSIYKGMTVEQQRQGTLLCKKYGIKIKAFLIFPLPGDTAETFEQTLKFAQEMQFDYVNMYKLTPFYGTQLWDNPEKFNIQINKEDINWDDVHQTSKRGILVHPLFTDEQINEYIARFHKEVNRPSLTYK